MSTLKVNTIQPLSGALSISGTSSYATEALSSSYATTASFSPSDFPYSGTAEITGSLLITGSINNDGNVIFPLISSSLNFDDDTAAASGGVPLGGLYRSGSLILIRLV